MEGDSLHLDEIANWIDRIFGDEYPVTEHADLATLRGVLGNQVYQRYFQDQVNRQIIRDYLTNAVVLGVITVGGLTAFASQMVTEEDRSTLSLYMLMSSVEEAKDLPAINNEAEPLQPLRPWAGEHPHIKLVPN